MFFIPLGILFHADVCCFSYCYFCMLMYFQQLTVAAYIRKSFIAAYLGNIVGALLVALPAVYFYLSDYNDLRKVEEGEGFNETGQGTPTSDLREGIDKRA